MTLTESCVRIFMVLEVIGIIIPFLLLIFLFGLPLKKRRPLFIRSLALAILLLFIFSFAALLFRYSILYIIGIVLAVILYYVKPPWVVFGLNRSIIQQSWERALIMTRTPHDELTFILVSLSYLSVVGFPRGKSKKTRLVNNVFRKLIENHYIFTKVEG